jgi:hypothetical protein
MTITVETIQDLTEVVAGLVAKGLTFEARQDHTQRWVITLTGGY